MRVMDCDASLLSAPRLCNKSEKIIGAEILITEPRKHSNQTSVVTNRLRPLCTAVSQLTNEQ